MWVICLTAIVLFLYTWLTKWYRWIYIFYKTIPRDLKAVIRFTKLNTLLWIWDRNNMTVAKVFATQVKKHPNKVAFYFEDDVWTFKQVDEYSNKLGNYFLSLDIKKGDVVGLLLENRPEYVCIWIGFAKIGVVTALINTNLTKESLIHSIEAANTNVLIYGSEFKSAIAEIRSSAKTLKLYQFHESSKSDATILPDSINLRDELDKASKETLIKHYRNGTIRDKLVYIYTSGTTGLPKAAVITNVRFFFMAVGLHFMTCLRPNDIVYDPLPLYHSAGGMVGVGQCLLSGNSVVLRKKFSASNFWKDCIKYNCTAAQYIGEICRFLLAVPQTEPNNHKVRIMFGNGLKPQIWDQFVKRFGITEIFEFYGSTEGNSNLVNIDSTCGAVGFVPRYAGSVYPVTLVRCDELTGEPLKNKAGRCTRCKPGEPGVFIGKINPKKAVLQFNGYADKEATEKKVMENVFRNGDMYFNSGDILVMDEFGYYYFKDRTGDTFRWKGENVATSEVEAVISNVVNLNDAVVYGVEIPDTDGKAGMAAIVDVHKTLDLQSLAKGAKASLPAYAVPLFIRVMKSVPMTSTFKLKKLDLQTDGYNPSTIEDDLYFYNSKVGSYVSLTKDLYDDIINGKVRV